MKKVFFVLFITLIVAGNSSEAVRWGIEAETGSAFSYRSLSINDEYDLKDDFSLKLWKLSYGIGRSETVDSSTNITNENNTKDIDGEIGFNLTEKWTSYFSVHTSNTVETKYTDSGGHIELSFLHQFVRNMNSDEDEELFSPLIGFGLSLGSSRIKQNISWTILSKIYSRDVELDQKSYTLSVSGQPWRFFSIRGFYTIYQYNKDKSQLSTAFQSRLLNFLSDNLITTIGGLQDSTSGISATFYYSNIFDLDISTSRTVLIADQSVLNSSSLFGTFYVYDWDLSLGFKLNTSSVSAEKNTSTSITLAYQF